MRVASRRLRSVLRDFEPEMRGGKRLEAAREELERLAEALGTVRDEDVAIHALEKLNREAPESARAGLELFALDRRARREGRRVELTHALEETSLEESKQMIADAFERATAPRSRKGDADKRSVEREKGDEGNEGERGGAGKEDASKGVDKGGEGGESFRELGRRVIGRLWEEFCERATDLYRPQAVRRLHKLRIAAKRLRYALELFAACFGEASKQLAHELADLQTALGNLHDCDHWIEECGKYLSEQRDGLMIDEASASERRDAAFWLLEHFAGKRTEFYLDALTVWRGMELDDFASRLAGCLDAADAVEARQ
jgi:CHAD domain-containing protein